MAQFLNFVNADGSMTDGLNLESIMSWSSAVTKEGEPYVLIRHTLLMPTLVPTKEPQPWVTRLTGSEREQFLQCMLAPGNAGLARR